MGVFRETERTVGSRERRLQIAQEGIDRAKLFQLSQANVQWMASCSGLFPAHRTLPVVQPLALEGAKVCAAAFRISKPSRPARSNQCCVAFILRPVIFHESSDRQFLFETESCWSPSRTPFSGIRLNRFTR